MPDRYHEGMRLTDTALAVLATARLSRLVITDDLGQWWVQEPVDRAMEAYTVQELNAAHRERRPVHEPWWWKYRDGLECPFCVGFWLGAGTLAAGALATRHPLTRAAWRLGAGALALNYVTAHLGVRLGDFDTEEDDE